VSTSSSVWALVPAAGVGSRMASCHPKQYLMLRDKPVIRHTLERLAQLDMLAGIYVGISASDQYWEEIMADVDAINDKPVRAYVGGRERADTVLNGLAALARVAGDSDRVLVHDAARPCVRTEDINELVLRVGTQADGGLLALPVADTVKRAGADQRCTETVPRDGLWRALTPQFFPISHLRAALKTALERGESITDEASAMELAGFAPQLVIGHSDNIKITHPEDLRMAGFYLDMQERLT